MTEAICKGAFTLGTACMVCSRCQKTIAVHFGPDAKVSMQQVAIAIMSAALDALEHEEQAREAEIVRLRQENEKLRAVFDLTWGLHHGADWNNGTHAQLYRKPLLDALYAARAALTSPEATGEPHSRETETDNG
jgi:hypothetical protein